MRSLVEKFLMRDNNINIPTPYYLYFHEQIKLNLNIFDKFEQKGIKVFYAIKSNNYIPLVKETIGKGFGIDAASKQEIEVALKLGADPSNISFSAPSKKEEDLKYANSVGIKYYAFDSEHGLRQIIKYCNNPILFGRIAVRNKQATFDLSSKFGMTHKYFQKIMKLSKANSWPLKGVTFHVGSQNISINSWKNALMEVDSVLSSASEFGLNIEYVNIGGGIPAPYSTTTKSLEYYVDNICLLCHALKTRYPHLKLFVEPGRAMSANTMALVSSVIDIKEYKKPPLIIVDTGAYNGLIEPLTDLELPILTRGRIDGKKFYKVAGFSCDGTDILNEKVLLPNNIKPGDKIIFLHAGAYTFVYSKFHLVSYPLIISDDLNLAKSSQVSNKEPILMAT